MLSRYKIHKTYRSAIHANVFSIRKKTKYANIKFPKPRTNISIGNFTGILLKRSKYYRRKRTRYGRLLRNKQKLINFYGNIKSYQFKKYLLDQIKLKSSLFPSFISLMERRIDVILMRMSWVRSIYQARQFVEHKTVILNNKIVNKPTILLNAQDIFSYKNKNLLRKFIRRSVRFTVLFKFCSKYLHMNYKLLYGGMYALPKMKWLSYPFKFRSRRVLEYYRN